jgi:hypothetical protein
VTGGRLAMRIADMGGLTGNNWVIRNNLSAPSAASGLAGLPPAHSHLLLSARMLGFLEQLTRERADNVSLIRVLQRPWPVRAWVRLLGQAASSKWPQPRRS